jgi:hypothetical protein
LCFRRALQLEEEFIKQMCNEIIAVKPDLVFTEKGVSGTMTVFKKTLRSYSKQLVHSLTEMRNE